jgi:cysteine synthase B
MATEYLPKIFDASKVDRVIEVSESEARAMTKRLALEEAFCRNEQRRISCNYCETEEMESGVIVAIICDGRSLFII